MAFTEVFPSIHMYIHIYTPGAFSPPPFFLNGVKKQQMPCSFSLAILPAGISLRQELDKGRQSVRSRWQLAATAWCIFLAFFSSSYCSGALVAYTPVMKTVFVLRRDVLCV